MSDTKPTSCQSCTMPFKNHPGQRASDQYCSNCFKDGKLTYEGNDLKEFQRLSYDGMMKTGMNKWKAKFFTWCIRFAPRWKQTK